MKTDDIVKHLRMQDHNLEYYKKRVIELENHVEYLKHPSDIINIEVDLPKESYTKEEITVAYNKMLKYEGIQEHRVGDLIIDTFISLLNGTHHSIKGKH